MHPSLKPPRRAAARPALRAILAPAAACLALVALPGRSAGPTLAEGRIAHGPFEIEAGVRRVSRGTFPNQGGNPFATRGVSEFRLRFQGQAVASEGGHRSFWRVLRLPAAPRPALLLVTQGFVLASQGPDGRLQLQPIVAQSAGLAELQWLDERQGQPGPSHTFGIEAVTDLQHATLLQGGRWLRLGARAVIDVATLTIHPVEPWVPIKPGVPITSVGRAGDLARAFSPGRTPYVLAASGNDYSRPEGGPAWGVLVVDIASGVTSEIRFDRRRFRFAKPADIDSAWIDHHFSWQVDAAGQEQLEPRDRFTPWPWRAKVKEPHPGETHVEVPNVDPAFIDLLKALLQGRPDSAMVDRRPAAGTLLAFTVEGCRLRASVQGSGKYHFDPTYALIGAERESALAVGWPACNRALRTLAGLIDAEFATGRHDALLKLE